MHAALPAPALVHVARGLAIGTASADDLHAAFVASTVYCERAERQGFRALGTPGDGVVPAFTSAEQLAIARGPVPWFTLSGAELLDLLPAGYDILLDIGGAHPLRLRPVARGRGRIGTTGATRRHGGRVSVLTSPTVRAATAAAARRVRGRRLPEPDGLLAAVGDAAAGVRYDQAHDVPFTQGATRSGREGRIGWDAWKRRSATRDLGQVSAELVVSATRAGIGAATAWQACRRTALAVFSLGAAELRRRCGVAGGPLQRTPGRPGIAAPVRGTRSRTVEAWRTNLHTPPRSARPARVWEGTGPNPPIRVTVAASLPSDEQEVRGVVLHSGPPVPHKEQHADPGRSR